MTKRGGKQRATAGRPYGRGKSGGDKKDCLARHRGRCKICKHREREEIEREFLDWMSPREIAETWKIASYRAIYRHAHAVGLFQRRRENRLAALDRIIERVGEVKVTAAAVVAAIRLSAKLDSEENHRRGGNLGGSPPATAAGGEHEFGIRNATGGTGTVRGDGVRAGQEFVLSLDGLPRTDAVTGHERCDGRGTLQRAPTVGGKGSVPNSRKELPGDDEPHGQGHRLKPVPPAGGRPGGAPLHRGSAAEGKGGRGDLAPTRGNGGSAGGKKGAGRAASRGDQVFCPPAAEAPCKTPPSKPPRERATEDGNSASGQNNEETAGGEENARAGMPAPLGAPPAPVEPEPRVVLGEDGRVAGMAWPWPKGKIVFAPRVRWRPGRGG